MKRKGSPDLFLDAVYSREFSNAGSNSLHSCLNQLGHHIRAKIMQLLPCLATVAMMVLWT